MSHEQIVPYEEDPLPRSRDDMPGKDQRTLLGFAVDTWNKAFLGEFKRDSTRYDELQKLICQNPRLWWAKRESAAIEKKWKTREE